MRSIVAACAAAVLVLAGCTDGSDGSDDDSGADRRPPEDLCTLLSVEDASRIVGVTYADASEPEGVEGVSWCSYKQASIEGPFTLTVTAESGSIAQAARGLELVGEVTEEPVDVPGADDAAALSTNDGDISVEQVAAEVGGMVYVVTFGGSTGVATQLMTAIVGEEDVPDNASDPVPDVCELDLAATERALGTAVEPELVGTESAWSSCTWDTGTGTDVTLSVARDAGGLDRYLVEHAYLPDGASAGEISVDGADDARLVEDPDAAVSQASAVAAVGALTYEVEVIDTAHQRAGSIATAFLAAAIGSS